MSWWRNRRGFVGYVGLALAVAVSLWSSQMYARDTRAAVKDTHELAVATRKLTLRLDQVQRDAFETTCARQNANRKAIRDTVQDFANTIGAYVVRVTPPERQDAALEFASQLIQIGKETAQRSAPPVSCQYPPREP